MSNNTQNISRCLLVNDLGLISYLEAWDYQKKLLGERLDNIELPDVLLLLEHPPVYTLGTGSTEKNIKFDLKKFSGQLFRTERGGEVTFHCPGQLVIYPILNLKYHRQDLHWYLRQLEEVVIQLLAVYGVCGQRIQGLTGVWVDNKKISAMGIKVKRWITMHGIAFNLCCDLSGFEQIIPCGIGDKSVTSLDRLILDCPTIDEVKDNFIKIFCEVFNYS